MTLNTLSLLLDAGNTCLKWAVFDGQSITRQQRCFYANKTAIQQLDLLLQKQVAIYSSSLSIVMVSVLGDEFNQKACRLASEYGLSFKQVKSRVSLANIKNGYDEPHKLGADRFVAMIGAYYLSNKPQHNKQQKVKKACIIIDSGTATTIDALDSQGNHLGGLILPGVTLCSRSLLKNTKQLALWGSPENQQKYEPRLFSRNTADAIQSASILGLSGAIEQISLTMEKQLKAKETRVQVDKYLCGGSLELLLPHLGKSFKAQEDLIMLGLIHSLSEPLEASQ